MDRMIDFVKIESECDFNLLNNCFVFCEIVNTRFYPEYGINTFLAIVIEAFEKNRERVRHYLENIDNEELNMEILH